MESSRRQRLQLQRSGAHFDAYSGVTTVWLLSTLGGSRNTKVVGVNKRDIMSLSIPKTCEVLLEKKSDYTLRSASNLLYGVTVCYGRKTDYVLADLVSVKSQLQRQLMETVDRRGRLLAQNVAPTTIFDGVNEYRNLLEFQKFQSTLHQQQRSSAALLVDDPLFDINQTRDISFLLGKGSKTNNSASSIHQHDIMDELRNGYSHETGAHAPFFERQRLSADQADLSALNTDIHLDFDDVMSDVEMGSAKSSDGRDSDHGDRVGFELSFDNDHVEPSESIEVPGLDIQLLGAADVDGNTKRAYPATGLEKNDIIKKKPKNASNSGFFVKLKLDDRIGLSTETLRNNNDHYCDVMDSEAKPRTKMHNKSVPEENWREVVFGEGQPPFLRFCFEELLLKPISQNSYDTSSSSIDFIERGRQKMRSLPSSRSSSSAMSTERGRKQGPADFTKVGSGSGNNLFDLPELEQIDEDGEVRNYSDDLENDIMKIDLRLPPSSFGRSSSKTDGGSRDHIDELRHMHTERRFNRDGTLQSMHDYTDGSNQSEQHVLNGEKQIHSQALDSQSRRLFEYILERASVVGKTTRSHQPFERKLLFEDLIPSNISRKNPDYSSEDGVSSVSRKICANAFLSLLQLASKANIDLHCFYPDTSFKSLDGDDIVIYV
ncbi:LAQU0S06e03312g1_1 [Lachancea quebecensis]|uniref:LAQU0S06e03312g1_1 n=1 Tax=Lachancea quebecensis TaxID=1654605 RepID=A0A0P1KS86_9SACH|nr:LAQU0S06e03312g1_1 [Lachancea quebecensis]